MALDLTKPNPTNVPAKPAQQKTGLAAVIRSKIANTLAGKKGEQFVTDVVTLVNNDPKLGKCDQVSLIAACLQAQTLNLSLNRNMGQAWIVPFEDRKNNRTMATFQIGYKGYVQLAIRSGQYRKLNVLAIKAGELVRWDPLFEDIEVELIADEKERAKAPTIGYYAMFEYINGFRKAMYWSRERMEEHAKQYSQAFRTDTAKGWTNSFWTKDFDAMAIKTMLRQLISKWGIMSVEMQTALEADGRLADGSFADGNVLDADFVSAGETVNRETGEVMEAPAHEKSRRGRRPKSETIPVTEPEQPLAQTQEYEVEPSPTPDPEEIQESPDSLSEPRVTPMGSYEPPVMDQPTEDAAAMARARYDAQEDAFYSM